MINKINKGFTLIEVVIVIFLIALVSTIVFNNLSSFRQDQILRSTTSDVVTLLNEAKQNTLSSVNSSSYGVHFETNRMILFSGIIYSSSDPNNKVVNFDDTVSIPSSGGLNIGGGSDVVFERLTGDTIGGTIKLQLNSNTSKYNIINISKTGLISSN